MTPSLSAVDLQNSVGFRNTAVNGRLFLDSDNNGKLHDEQNIVDEPLSVQLRLRSTDQLLATTLVADDGTFQFDTSDGLLGNEQYTVRLVDAESSILTRYWLTEADVTSNEQYDSDGVLALPHIDALYESSHWGEAQDLVAFGFITRVSVFGVVWHDVNGDGVRDVNVDVGLSNVDVVLNDIESG